MDKKYLLKSSIRVSRLSRLLAKVIDLFIVGLLSFFIYPLGISLSIVYLALSDGLQNGQSVGKRFIGFRVVSLEDGGPCSFKQSAIRNLPLLIPLTFAAIPFWGFIIGAVLAVPLVLFEIYLIYKIESGNRLGDVMADTTVIAGQGSSALISSKGQDSTSWFGTEPSP